MTPVNIKRVGPYSLIRFPALGKIVLQPIDDGEGGPMPLADFTREVCPWDELGEGMEERVREFYGRNF